MRPSHRTAAPWLLAGALLAALASTAMWPPSAHSADDDCALTSRQKAAAVKAFRALSPIFQDPRCLNCHGSVNPFSRNGGHGTHVDIRAEARRFLERPDARSALLVVDDPTGASKDRALRSIRRIAESRVEITDNDVIRREALEPMLAACRECHVSDWIIPMSHNYFAGRDWKAMCRHVKTSSLTNSPVKFLRHMQKDALVLEGFKGLRGLTDAVPAEPPSMPFETMVSHAKEWIAAMGGRYLPPADCGCKADGILLEIRHRLWTDPESGSSKAGFAQFDGTVTFDVLLRQLDGAPEGWFRDEVTVTRQLEVRHVRPAFIKCAGSGFREEEWLVTAQLDSEAQTIQVDFSFTDEAQEASWTCTGPGYTSTDPVRVDVHGNLYSLEISAMTGAVSEATARDAKELESITMTVIDSPFGH